MSRARRRLSELHLGLLPSSPEPWTHTLIVCQAVPGCSHALLRATRVALRSRVEKMLSCPPHPFTPSLQLAPEASFRRQESVETAAARHDSSLLRRGTTCAGNEGLRLEASFEASAGAKHVPPPLPPLLSSVLRLHARVAPDFIRTLHDGSCDGNIGALQNRFPSVYITSSSRDGMRGGLVEVAGRNHDAVRACADAVGEQVSAFVSSRLGRACARPPPPQWAAAPPDARPRTGCIDEAALRAPSAPPPSLSPPPVAALRLRARCAPSFVKVLCGPGGAAVKALQRDFRVGVNSATTRRTFGIDLAGATSLPLEVAGCDHAAVRACAAEVSTRYGAYVKIFRTHPEFKSGAPRALEWTPAPPGARFGLGGADDCAARASEEEPARRGRGGEGERGARGRSRSRSRSRGGDVRSRSKHRRSRKRSRSRSLSRSRKPRSRSRSRGGEARSSRRHSRKHKHSRSRSHRRPAAADNGLAPPVPAASSPQPAAPLPQPSMPMPPQQPEQQLPQSSEPAPLPLLPSVPALSPATAQPAVSPPVLDDTIEEWFYRAKVTTHGPFSIARLRTFKPVLVAKGKWGALRVWRAGQNEAEAIHIAHLLPDAATRESE